MWSAVVLLALVSTLDPIRVGIAAVLIARPRPMMNLLVYWLGLMAMGMGIALTVLLFLPDHVLPVTQAVMSAASNPVVPPLQIALGAVAVPIAVVIGVRRWSRAPAAALSAAIESTETVPPPPQRRLARLTWPALLHGRWGGSLGIAFAAGLFSATPPLEYCLVLLAIVASGAAVGIQIGAALVFVLIAFAVAEIPLIGHLASPAKTRAVVMRLHDCIHAFRGRITAIALGVFGILTAAHGLAGI